MRMTFKQQSFLVALSVAATGWLYAAEMPAAKDLYAKKCAMCHGKDFKGNPAMAKSLKVEPPALSLLSPEIQAKKDDELIKITTDGKNKMPAQKGKLSDAEIASLIAYIRSVAPPADKTQ